MFLSDSSKCLGSLVLSSRSILSGPVVLVGFDSYSSYLDLATDARSDTIVQEIQLAQSLGNSYAMCWAGAVHPWGGNSTGISLRCFGVCLLYTALFASVLGNSFVQVLCWKICTIYVSTVNNSLWRIRGMQFKWYSGTWNAG